MKMTPGMWLLAGVAVGFAYLIIFCLMKMSKDSDREARRLEKHLAPFSDVDITYTHQHL